LIGKKVIIATNFGGGSAPDWGPPPEKPPANADKNWYDNQSRKGTEITAEIVGVADNRSMDDKQNYVTLGWAGNSPSQFIGNMMKPPLKLATKDAKHSTKRWESG